MNQRIHFHSEFFTRIRKLVSFVVSNTVWDSLAHNMLIQLHVGRIFYE